MTPSNSDNFYDAPAVERKLQAHWDKKKAYNVDLKDAKRPKYYNLVMFPYPSGDKLHIGHWYNFGPADSWGRYMRMKGFNVFEPMGFDAFGLPAENYAIKTGIAPATSTAANVAYMIKQLKELGAMYDWSQTVNTSELEYYKWTQWLFLEMYKRGLAYKKKAPVNWCPGCKTVLANEQVQDGICDRCKSEVTKKNLEQWFWKIRDYAEKLLDYKGLDWPEKTKLMQEHWIGRSEGSNIVFDIKGTEDTFTVFTTRIDTLFGCTYVVLAPEHALVAKLVTSKQKNKVQIYLEKTKKLNDIDRSSENREKTGVFTGSYAINPINGEKVPIWVADYVLASYGSGAVMAVPGHDTRDYEFAKKYDLPIKPVIVPSIHLHAKGSMNDLNRELTAISGCFVEDGRLIHSGEFTSMTSAEARVAITELLAKKGKAAFVVNYKLRDWLISRQRYWGAPIPIINCKKCGKVTVPEKDLPVILPRIKNYKPKGKAPLATSPSFMKTKCPTCKGPATREPDTMDTFVCSSWYYLRYPCATLKNKPFDPAVLKHWGPVDMYIGGPEHACMHLLYARFVNQVLYDAGHVPFKEPFKRLVHQGMVTKDGAKMSKSRGNVVSPDEFVQHHGSDVFRMYLMFMGPFTQGGDWNDKGISGISRFVQKFWKVVTGDTISHVSPGMLSRVHRTVKKVTEDIEAMHFNTAIAALMEFMNEASKEGLDAESKKAVVRLIAPMAPHLAEELWSFLQGTGHGGAALSKKWASVFDADWPTYDVKLTVEDTIELIIQINGKVRATVGAAKDISKEDALKLARLQDNVRRHLESVTVVKEIYVPGKLVNFVVR